MQYHLPPKRLEDNHSETSGDTGTSDSGRGGSDEEIHNSFSYTHRERPPGMLECVVASAHLVLFYKFYLNLGLEISFESSQIICLQ